MFNLTSITSWRILVLFTYSNIRIKSVANTYELKMNCNSWRNNSIVRI